MVKVLFPLKHQMELKVLELWLLEAKERAEMKAREQDWALKELTRRLLEAKERGKEDADAGAGGGGEG